MRILTIVVVLVLARAAFADWIELNDGTRVRGTVLLVDDSAVQIRTKQGVVTFDRERVRQVHRRSTEAPERNSREPVIEIVDDPVPTDRVVHQLKLQALTTPTEFRRVDGTVGNPLKAENEPPASNPQILPKLFDDGMPGFEVVGRFVSPDGRIGITCERSAQMPRNMTTLTRLKEHLGVHLRQIRRETREIRLLGFDLAHLSVGPTIRTDLEWGPPDARVRELGWWVRTTDGALHRLTVRAASADLAKQVDALDLIVESWEPQRVEEDRIGVR